MRQATHVTGIRTARYIGLDKTSLEHAAAAAAVNLLRLDAWWTRQAIRPDPDNSPPAARLQPRRLSQISQQGPCRHENRGWLPADASDAWCR
jgi:hypothetical protein